MKTQHTQGEWKIRGTAPTVYVETDNDIICSVEKFVNKNSVYDAKLIAAAPELLEALMDIYDAQYNPKRTLASLNSAVANSIEAIKKATT